MATRRWQARSGDPRTHRRSLDRQRWRAAGSPGHPRPTPRRARRASAVARPRSRTTRAPRDVGRPDEGATLAPATEVALRIGTLLGEAAAPLEHGSGDADRAAASGRGPRAASPPTACRSRPSRSRIREDLGGDLVHRGGSALDGDQGPGWLRPSSLRRPWPDRRSPPVPMPPVDR